MENQNPISQLENLFSSMNLGGLNDPNPFSLANLLGERETIDEFSSSLPMILDVFGSSTQCRHCWNSSLPHERSSLPQSNQGLQYRSVTEDTNGGGFCGVFSSMQEILNDARFDSDDPSLLYELREVDIVKLAKNLKGSQYLKRILDCYGEIVMRKIFKAVVSSCNIIIIIDLITNEFGKNMFQKLLDLCNPNQIEELVLRLANQEDALFWVSINKNGTNCVQKLIKMVRKLYLIVHIKEALAPRLFDLMIHQTGHHVIRTCLELLDRRHNDTIFEVAKRSCLNLAVHSQGCLTLNTCIDHMTEDHKRGLLDIIIENSVFLAQDPHGNYVVQHVLRIHNPFVNRRICHNLQEFYVRLSMQKSGSHVVETCAKSGGIVYVVNDLVQSDKLVEVAKNQFGNYVIQTVLKATKSSYPGLNLRLEIALQPHLAELQYHPNGRNVYNLIKEGIINPFNGIKQSLHGMDLRSSSGQAGFPFLFFPHCSS